MVRGLRPTDLPRFLKLRRSALPNQALTRTTPSPTPPTIFDFARTSMLVPPHRHGWIDLHGRESKGIASVRGRAGSDIWDIEQLILPFGPGGNETCATLLDTICETASDHGIQRIFLRVDAESQIVNIARKAGFRQYLNESLFRLPRAPKEAEWLPPPFRPRRPSDHLSLFQLYNTIVPADVRSLEGLTLQEWRWSDGWGLRPVNFFTQHWFVRQDFVMEEDGRICAWLKVVRHHRTMELEWLPERSGDLNEMLRFGALVLGSWLPSICVVRSYQSGIRLPLESLGFRQVGEHALLVRSLLARVRQPQLMPVGV